MSFFTDVVKPKTSKSESPRTRIRAFSEQKTPSPLSSDAHKSLGRLMVPFNLVVLSVKCTPLDLSPSYSASPSSFLPPLFSRPFFSPSSPLLSSPLFFSPLPVFTLSLLPPLQPPLSSLYSPPSSSLTASATNPRSHSPVDFYDPPDRETMRLQKFGKLLAGPNTDLGKSCQSH